jgi:hypothetical protein
MMTKRKTPATAKRYTIRNVARRDVQDQYDLLRHCAVHTSHRGESMIYATLAEVLRRELLRRDRRQATPLACWGSDSCTAELLRTRAELAKAREQIADWRGVLNRILDHGHIVTGAIAEEALARWPEEK